MKNRLVTESDSNPYAAPERLDDKMPGRFGASNSIRQMIFDSLVHLTVFCCITVLLWGVGMIVLRTLAPALDWQQSLVNVFAGLWAVASILTALLAVKWSGGRPIQRRRRFRAGNRSSSAILRGSSDKLHDSSL